MLLPRRHCRNRSHVVETIGQLNDENPQILGHRHQHFANGGCLLRFFGIELDAIEFRDAIDDTGDIFPEVPFDIDKGGTSVFDGIVKQCRRDGHIVEA